MICGRKRFNTLMSRTFFTGVLVSVIVLMAVTMIMGIWFQNWMTQNYRKLIENNIRNIDTAFTSRIDAVEKMAADAYMSVDGISLRTDPDTDFVQHMSYITTTQEMLKRNGCIASVIFINREREIILHIGGEADASSVMETELYELIQERDMRKESFVWQMEDHNSAITFLTCVFAEKSFGSEGFCGMTAVSIDLSKLNEEVMDHNQEETLQVIALDKEGTVAMDSQRKLLGQNVISEEWYQGVLQQKKLYRIADKEYLYKNSHYDSYIWVSITNYGVRTKQFGGLFRLVIMVLIMAVFVMVILLWAAGKRIFDPFNNLVSRIREESTAGDGRISKLPGEEGDEVYFLTNYYRNITEYSKYLSKARKRELIVQKLESGDEDCTAFFQEENYIVRGGSWCLLFVCIRETAGKIRNLQNYDQVRHQIAEAYQRTFFELGECIYLEVGLRYVMLVVSSIDLPSSGEIRDKAEELGKRMKLLYQMDAECVVSDVIHDDGEKLPGVYRILYEKLKKKEAKPGASPKQSEMPAAGGMEDAVDYIRSHYSDSMLSAGMLADRLGISAAYFGQLFNEFTGIKINDFILRTRMEKAYELLLSEEEKTVAEVAADVGYNSSTYFSTVFRKFYGYTPSHFREYNKAVIHMVKDKTELE